MFCLLVMFEIEPGYPSSQSFVMSVLMLLCNVEPSIHQFSMTRSVRVLTKQRLKLSERPA